MKRYKNQTKKHKTLKIVSFSLLGVIILGLTAFGGVYAYTINYRPEAPKDTSEKKSDLFFTENTGLYDKDGKLFTIRGINAGNYFLQEGWISPFALEPLTNEDGTYVKDKDGNIQYPEFSQEDFLNGLLENPNCGEENIDERLDYYYDAWWSENDFKIIKDVGFNTIRLPFYWRNILNDDFSRKSEEVAFEYLDWFIENCKNNGLYVILDLHGAPGSQNGYEHSGNNNKNPELWSNVEYMDATNDLWDYVSTHYNDTRKDLSYYIIAYDLLNEPTETYGSRTTKVCHDFFDRLYDTIRENGDNHVISMEGCWDFSVLPNPDKYGWENVIYQYHIYNWYTDILPYNLLWAYFQLTNFGKQYKVPVLIGEFTFFNNEKEWSEGLKYFDDMHYGWTIWTYKATVTGWWDTSWGLYTVKLNLDTSKEELKCNVKTCTFEEFKSTCDETRTENCESEFLMNTMNKYFNGEEEIEE